MHEGGARGCSGVIRRVGVDPVLVVGEIGVGVYEVVVDVGGGGGAREGVWGGKHVCGEGERTKWRRMIYKYIILHVIYISQKKEGSRRLGSNVSADPNQSFSGNRSRFR
jgi:hypothetical protein